MRFFGYIVQKKGGREGGREGGRKGGREGESEGAWEGGREERREGNALYGSGIKKDVTTPAHIPWERRVICCRHPGNRWLPCVGRSRACR